MFCLTATPAIGWTADPPEKTSNAVQAQTMVVRATLNTEDKGDIFVGRTADLDFFVKAEDLVGMGLSNLTGVTQTIDGSPHLSLKSLKGVSFAFDERTLTLNLTADAQLLGKNAFDLQGRPRTRGLVSTGSSGFFNYAFDYAKLGSDPDHRIGFAGEAGWRYGDFLFLSDANTVQSPSGSHKLVRLTTSVTHDNREALRRTVVGDFFTPTRDLSTGVNLGGISVTKVYGLDPYLIRFPLQNLTGNVALPSDLDVYLDGQKIRTERLRPGEFELRDILAYGGARNVQLVLRDSFGRTQQLDYSFYFSDQPLRQGLHEYSYNAGAFRRNYGLRSNDYGPPAFSAFHRYGFTDAITLGLRADGAKGFLNAGPTATLVLGSAGVINATFAASTLGGQGGGAGAINYIYQTRAWNFGLSLRHDSRSYAVLGDPPTVSNRKHEGNISVGLVLPRSSSISLNHSFLKTREPVSPFGTTPARPVNFSAMEDRRVTALSYNATLVPGRVYLISSLSHIKDKTSRNELFFGLNFVLDKDYSAAGNVRGNRQNHTESVQLTKNQPIGEGLGYTLSADHARSPAEQSRQLGGTIQYNAPIAILRGEYGRRSASGVLVDDVRLSAAGGIAYVAGETVLGRPISGSFGIVKVGELPDVAVSVNGQPIGKTNARGKIFVPMLSADFDNDVSISAENVPMDYAFPATVKQVAPTLRSGMLIDFAVTRLQAFTGVLLQQRGSAMQPVALKEFSYAVGDVTQTLQTGAAGEFYLENAKPGTYPARAVVEGKPCVFDLVIPKSAETFVELGKLVCKAAP